MTVTSEVITAQRAVDLGLIDEVMDDLDAGLEWAIAALGPNHSVAIELNRRLLNECYAASAENAIGHFLAAQHRAIAQTAFLETLKRERDKE
jgi:enoyl-CoA hydratase/carnithine racemase